MKIKDIVNRDIVNLENCESEPIHVPGSIQPHGLLLGLDFKDLSIKFCSGNSEEFIGVNYKQLLGKKLETIIDLENFEKVKNHLTRNILQSDLPISIRVGDRQLECISHDNGKFIILEFVIGSNHSEDDNHIYLQTRQFIEHIEKSNSLKSLCQSVADNVRLLTGYDRVMIYRFDEDYNGEVFAESLNQQFEPFLGLHYPHTDIPQQARQLYLKNMLRVIDDINYKYVPIYTLDDGSNEPLDLSCAVLRSVSPIHIQYLQNMGVGATMTISLIHQERLWGLIACHHYSPKNVSFRMKMHAKLQGHFLTSHINAREVQEEHLLTNVLNKNLEYLIVKYSRLDHNTIEQLVQSEQLLKICNATGVALLVNNRLYTHGLVPESNTIMEQFQWLDNNTKGHLTTDHFSSLFKSSPAGDNPAAGIIFQSLGNGSSIIWYRQESLREINWAGDPEKAILKDESGLHPRKSFNLWKQKIKDRSKPWSKPEVEAVFNFTHFLQKNLHLMYVVEEEVRYKALNEKLLEANSELENINRIGTHDLKEPVRKIQTFASRILNENDNLPEQIVKQLSRINAAALRMELLIRDLTVYSRIANISEAKQKVDLNRIINASIDEKNEELKEIGGSVHCDQFPHIFCVDFLIKQVFVNLLSNSIKFRKEDELLKIYIKYLGVTAHQGLDAIRFHEIVFSDNGIGFQDDIHESIFHIFVRSPQPQKYEGLGIGLSLCKKIIVNHNGYISATGSPGKGASFTILLPE